MKKILSFLLIVILICSTTVVSVSAENKKISQRMINYLSQYEDTDIVRINIEFYSDIRVMDMWEYFWRNGVNMSRFENDKEYSIQCVTEYHDYESELSEKIEAQMLDFYNSKIKICDDYPVLTIGE